MQLSKCPLCSSSKYKVIFPSTIKVGTLNYENLKSELKNTLESPGKHGRYVKCINCGLMYINPPENYSMMKKGYSNVIDEVYLKTEIFRKKLSNEHLNKLENFSKKGNLLDVGCFAGFFLRIARKRKWKVEGIEPSSWATKIARKEGIKIIGKYLEQTKLRNNYYDAITFWDVIEHLTNPHGLISLIEPSLKKGGIIAFGTPNIDSLLAKVMGKKFPYLVRMHVILYSPKTLSQLLIQHNFEIVYKGFYGRTFPIKYILERFNISLKNGSLNSNKLINKLLNTPITLNLHDSFILIARKK